MSFWKILTLYAAEPIGQQLGSSTGKMSQNRLSGGGKHPPSSSQFLLLEDRDNLFLAARALLHRRLCVTDSQASKTVFANYPSGLIESAMRWLKSQLVIQSGSIRIATSLSALAVSARASRLFGRME